MIKLNNIRLIAMNIVEQVIKSLETVVFFSREPVSVKIKKVTFPFIIKTPTGTLKNVLFI